MLVSWKWLSRYVDLPMPLADVENRLALSGLNHESTTPVGDDFAIDLEVTSNRGDCLCHLGIAREIAVLFDLGLRKPLVDTKPPSGDPRPDNLSVRNEFQEACPHYSARVIQGAKVGPSPEWLVSSLKTIGVSSVNNVVDATNYVMFECGQPLHAFDLDLLSEQTIVVRPAKQGETLRAIDHRQYSLDPSMCVIADAVKPVAIAGVMGGLDTEVGLHTRNLLIEAAAFTPLSIRRTARKLKLFSPSSFRFERRVDISQIDWASRRVCEIIIGIAGGELVDETTYPPASESRNAPITLRTRQIRRILGIDIEHAEARRILTAIGCEERDSRDGNMLWTPPTWRHDLNREIDLIEELARIHGYDRIPEDKPIHVVPSAKRPFDVAMEKTRNILVAAGFTEAMTPSVVTDKLDKMASPWTDRPALHTQIPMLEGARRLRRSLIPSLLHCRGINWASSGTIADLFEIAHIYLPEEQITDLPKEQYTLGMVAGGDFFALKGAIDAIASRLGLPWPLKYSIPSTESRVSGFEVNQVVEIWEKDDVVGYLAVIDPKLTKELKLPDTIAAAELSIPVLLKHASLVPIQKSISPFPSIHRDLNLIVQERVLWAELEQTVRGSVGRELVAVRYRETYRDPTRDGPGRKRVLLTVALQKNDSTLTSGEADSMIRSIITACEQTLGAKLLS